MEVGRELDEWHATLGDWRILVGVLRSDDSKGTTYSLHALFHTLQHYHLNGIFHTFNFQVQYILY